MSRHRITNRAKAVSARRVAEGRRRRPRRHPELSAWLGAGALTVGVGAALASGSGIAHADTSQSASPHSTGSEASSSTTPDAAAGRRNARRVSHDSLVSTTGPMGTSTQTGPARPATSVAAVDTKTTTPEHLTPNLASATTSDRIKSISTLATAAIGTGTPQHTGLGHQAPATAAGTTSKTTSSGTSALAAAISVALEPQSHAALGQARTAAARVVVSSLVKTATPAAPTASVTAVSTTPIVAAAVTPTWAPSPFAPIAKVFVGLLLSIGGMNSANPNPTNPVQQLLYSLAKGLNDTFDPAPSAGTPTVGTPDPSTGTVTGSLGFPAGSDLTYTATQPSQGTVNVASDGSYTYTPTQAARQAATFTTTDTFTATVHEGLSTNAVTVTVPVDPITLAVQTMTRPNGQIWGFLLGSDPEGDPITYTLDQTPRFGTVSISQCGVYTYTPGPDFTGTDTFTATIDDPGLHSSTVPVTVVSNPATPAGTVIDNFNGPAGSRPNPALWSSAVGWDAGLQTYTDSPDNVRLDGQGHLIIQALNTPDVHTSGRVVTQGNLDMLYGAMTARIKFPSGQGIWPAFWQLGSTYNQATNNAQGPTGWPGCGEIDVMELVNNGKTYYVTLHGPQGNTAYYGGVNGTGQVVGTSGPIADLTGDFHDYWVMREPDIIVVGVDDTMLATFTPASLPAGGTWVFNKPFFAVFNIAVGGRWPGPPDNTTPWPATMLVDSFSYTP